MNDISGTLRANMGDNQPAVCYAVKTKQIDMRTSNDTAHPLDSNDDKEPQAVCYSPPPAAFMGGQGARARSIAYCDDGTTPTLKAVMSGGNTVPDVVYPSESARDYLKNMSDVYAIEGNSVDRASHQNGRGWCFNVSPTLNTQDRHAVVIALEGNGARPSHLGAGGYSEDGTMYTLNTIERHSVCYGVDGRNNRLSKETIGTLQAHNDGGWSINCTHPVLYEKHEE